MKSIILTVILHIALILRLFSKGDNISGKSALRRERGSDVGTTAPLKRGNNARNKTLIKIAASSMFLSTPGSSSPPQMPMRPAIKYNYSTGASPKSSPIGMNLIWFSNDDGLFSQFLQMKIMYTIARTLKRTLVIAPIHSSHFPSEPLVLCDIFDDLPQNIRCLPTQSHKMKKDSAMRALKRNPINGEPLCMDEIRLALKINARGTKREDVSASLCYKGLIPYLGEQTRREAVLKGLQFRSINMKINKRHNGLIWIFKKSIGVLSQVAPLTTTPTTSTAESVMKDPSTSYWEKDLTVVHWRRGDQLSSRCAQGRDMSVNCRDAADLIRLVRNFTQSRLINNSSHVVYIATNEDDKQQLNTLSEAGFKLFRDGEMHNISRLTAFLVEVSLMMSAKNFLAWGVSEVDDVVEWQRSVDGKSYCISNQYIDSQNITLVSNELRNIKRSRYIGSHRKNPRAKNGTFSILRQMNFNVTKQSELKNDESDDREKGKRLIESVGDRVWQSESTMKKYENTTFKQTLNGSTQTSEDPNIFFPTFCLLHLQSQQMALKKSPSIALVTKPSFSSMSSVPLPSGKVTHAYQPNLTRNISSVNNRFALGGGTKNLKERLKNVTLARIQQVQETGKKYNVSFNGLVISSKNKKTIAKEKLNKRMQARVDKTYTEDQV